jgi:surface protein
MSGLFGECISLDILPDISNWNTKNVCFFSMLFYRCSKIEQLPDISNWKIFNGINEKSSFEKYFDLFSKVELDEDFVIDLKKIKTYKDDYSMGNMEAKFITSGLISKMKATKKQYFFTIDSMFGGCTAIKKLPDISKWKIDNARILRSLFSGCQSLKSIPDISNWNTNNITDMNFVFAGCSSLELLPDISKWNTNKVINMKSLF